MGGESKHREGSELKGEAQEESRRSDKRKECVKREERHMFSSNIPP